MLYYLFIKFIDKIIYNYIKFKIKIKFIIFLIGNIIIFTIRFFINYNYYIKKLLLLLKYH